MGQLKTFLLLGHITSVWVRVPAHPGGEHYKSLRDLKTGALNSFKFRCVKNIQLNIVKLKVMERDTLID